MRHVIASLIILLVLVAAGCTAVDTTEENRKSPPESGLESVAREAFGASLLSVTSGLVETGTPYAVVVLDSDLSLRDIDTAAAAILAHLASEDASSTPIWVSVSGSGLAPEGSAVPWGRLVYDWGLREPSGERGSTVTLLRGEDDPPGPPPDEIDVGPRARVEARGVWRKVNLETLSEWSRIGTPEPEPSSP